VFMPPTLIASVYGMNFRHMPELDWPWSYPAVLCTVVLVCVLIYARFRRNDWLNNWRELGVYDYFHYHSTSHEVLGMARGSITLRLGGEGGTVLTMRPGDVLVLPAGTSHTRLDNSPDSHMVGGYPDGRDWDLIRDEQVSEADFRAAIKLIGSLPIPARDPATGEVMTLWRDAPRTYGIPF